MISICSFFPPQAQLILLAVSLHCCFFGRVGSWGFLLKCFFMNFLCYLLSLLSSVVDLIWSMEMCGDVSLALLYLPLAFRRKLCTRPGWRMLSPSVFVSNLQISREICPQSMVSVPVKPIAIRLWTVTVHAVCWNAKFSPLSRSPC